MFEAVADFTKREVLPFAEKWDKEHIFPADTLRAAAALGLGGIQVAPEFGGSGLGRVESSLVYEAMSAGCPSTAAYLSIHNMTCGMVERYAQAELKSRVLPAMTSMEKMGSYCLTEPGSGSDAAALLTRAVPTRTGAEYVLNGTKAFISGGGASDVYLVMARTGDAGPKGITCFAVEKGTPGLAFGALEEKMGWRSSPTRAVILEDCVVPKGNILGQLGQGFKIAMNGLDGGRVSIASCSLGGAQACLEAAIAYTGTRKQFGSPIASLQATQFKIADMAAALATARLVVRRAARAMDASSPHATYLSAMAKRYATDECFDVVNKALQLHGGYGYLSAYGVERYLRDLRVHQILEGTNEIMRVIMARKILQEN
jgi:alkylation response protein AidB-like acyl-CoA dehydrogenase